MCDDCISRRSSSRFVCARWPKLIAQRMRLRNAWRYFPSIRLRSTNSKHHVEGDCATPRDLLTSLLTADWSQPLNLYRASRALGHFCWTNRLSLLILSLVVLVADWQCGDRVGRQVRSLFLPQQRHPRVSRPTARLYDLGSNRCRIESRRCPVGSPTVFFEATSRTAPISTCGALFSSLLGRVTAL